MHYRTHFPRPRLEKPLNYFLKDGKPVPAEEDEQAFAAFLFDAGRRVANTLLYAPDGTRIHISTGFLCFDENWPGDGLPVLWETQIFWPGNDELDYWIKRYTSAEAARAGHEEALALVKAALAEKWLDSHTTRILVIALPHELTDEQRAALIQDFQLNGKSKK